MSHRAASWLAWSLVALSGALVVGGIVLGRTTTVSPALELPYGSFGDADSVVLSLATVLTFSVVGAIVASRHPRNIIGWIFCTVGLVTGLDALTRSYAEFWLARGWGSRNLGETAAWFATWAWTVQTIAVTFLLLLFPDGRLPSPRWRPVAWCAGLAISGFALGSALNAGPLADFPQIVNPYGIDSPLVRVLGIAAGLVVVGCMVASAISLIVRALRAGRVELQQIKWLAYGGAVVVGISLVAGAIAIWSVTVSIAVTILAWLGLPVFTGVAILRYRLYEIDILINRTLVYGSLTVSLALLYFAGVTATQAFFRTLTGQQQQPQIAIVVSTLAIAALFNPLKRRIQAFIDRRFYRKKYDARETLEAFSVKLREETDLQTINNDLVGVVRETLAPEHVSLWQLPLSDVGRDGESPR